MIDDEAALECVIDWLPDFIAWAENPNHVDAQRLYERGRKTVHDSFSNTYADDPDVDPGEVLVSAMTTVTLLTAFAEWHVAARELANPKENP